MSTIKDKKLEAFTDKLWSKVPLEQPSVNFTNLVMQKVQAINNKKTAIVYKPLISKKVWLLIGLAFAALVVYLLFKNPASDSSTPLNYFNWSTISINPLENVSFNFSKTLIYAVVLFTIMLGIQIPILKHYFNRRLSF